MTPFQSHDSANSSVLPGHRSGGKGLWKLPTEILVGVLEQLGPFKPLTTHNSNAAKPEVHQGHLTARASFANLCRVSSWIRPHATRQLYQHVLLMEQRELLLLFRTIANNRDHGLAIRSFAWAGILSGDEASLEVRSRGENEMAALAPDCWVSVHDNWPSDDVSVEIARRMGISDAEHLQNWRVLGAILGMMPRLQSLFLVQSFEPVPFNKLPPCLEQQAIWALVGPPYQGNTFQFLQEVRTITLEPHSNVRGGALCPVRTLIALLANSSSIRRLELKAGIILNSITSAAQRIFHARLLTEGVQELLYFFGRHAQADLGPMLSSFPTLESLEVEYRTGSVESGGSEKRVLDALLSVSGTLVRLSLITTPKHSWRDGEATPLLPGLCQMEVLKHLTTESIWLFGNQFDDSSETSQLLTGLPTSLVQLHVIDYWGKCDTDDLADTDSFYPQFPNAWSTTLWFYDKAFSNLYQDCSERLSSLKDVMLSLHPLRQGQISPASGEERNDKGPPETVAAFREKFQALFSGIGVRFSVVEADVQLSEICTSWAGHLG